MRKFNVLDQVIREIDVAIRTLLPPTKRVSDRPSPAKDLASNEVLTANQKKHVAGLMRVNHAGEVCAQALYQGQALTARLTDVRAQMVNAAEEEVDHLAWCEQRLHELNSQPSLFNPIWYIGSFTIGALAGLVGDKFSLGFLAETELQVSAHLQKHLEKLPLEDKKTPLILKQMQEDEAHHAEVAKQAGAIELPEILKYLMNKTSKLMTKTSYYI
ncbi:2-polyprenyl-3-methyl-6-methoxy-1,4-benzoquinone monooxygenase [Legionella sp. D16C41]|uniref:2-polyprenyl-3-methyl-6-methoxy-1,4-benzoquinone monooxygenase n=1 Tax=Legionella sp. D16C41 TaxID=3402688 RepID=UPI003AF4FA61